MPSQFIFRDAEIATPFPRSPCSLHQYGYTGQDLMRSEFLLGVECITTSSTSHYRIRRQEDPGLMSEMNPPRPCTLGTTERLAGLSSEVAQ